MARFQALVDVMLKSGISDPQGQTIERALPALGHENVSSVRVGKHIQMDVDAASAGEAEAQVTALCERLLANPVIESFQVTIK